MMAHGSTERPRSAALVRRAALYGLMAGGRRGAFRAVQIPTREIVQTMALLGVGSVTDRRPERVSLRPRPPVPDTRRMLIPPCRRER